MIVVICCILFALLLMFAFGPYIVTSVIDTYDAWVSVFKEIRERRSER